MLASKGPKSRLWEVAGRLEVLRGAGGAELALAVGGLLSGTKSRMTISVSKGRVFKEIVFCFGCLGAKAEATCLRNLATGEALSLAGGP